MAQNKPLLRLQAVNNTMQNRNDDNAIIITGQHFLQSSESVININ